MTKSKHMNTIIKRILLSFCMIAGLLACSDEKLESTIFDTAEKSVDSTKATYKFDLYLYNNFLKPYNLDFMYRMSDVAADMEYNLVPASYDNSKKLAVLVKYLWFDAYADVAPAGFMKRWGPRQIHLIGSPAYNPANGTMVLGLAEGGIKISLFRVNSINTSDVNMMNEYYFKTMHHEFAHILHQTKTYPKEFRVISVKDYDPFGWQDLTDEVAQGKGFVSAYASSQAREDFVEVIANYIVKTDSQWNTILTNGAKGKNSDAADGKTIILKKLSICRNWLRDSWSIDLDSLRANVQRRQANINMTKLLSEIE